MDSIPRNQATMAQIRCLEDSEVNPLTKMAWPLGHDNILQGRRKLPAYERFEEILDAYHQGQVFVLSSETGSGKSTQVPQLLLYDEYSSGKRVACTQPRRLAATSLAKRVAKEMGVALGEEVGYQIGGDKKVNKKKKKTLVTFMTEGVLLAQQGNDKDLSDYACIVIDEAHERTIETDLLMAMLKGILRRRQDFKVVIMSATMNAQLFKDYFNCGAVEIPGRNFNVDIRYTMSGETSSSVNVLAANTVAHIHKNLGPGHILVFLPGKGEIGEVCKLVRKRIEDIDVFPLYSTLIAGEQSRALDSSGPNRKCIVSTNIAETSLTIDNVVYVIDCGLSRQMIYNARLGMNMLQVLPISQASAKQRTGRAGRTRNGVCFRLYSKEDFDRMPLSTEPAVSCSSVHAAALRVLVTGNLRVADFNWVEIPHPEAIARAAQDLQDWGYLEGDGKPTYSGYLAAACPLDPIWYHAIEEGAKLGCAQDIADIAAVCSSQKDIFLRPVDHLHAADVPSRAMAGLPSDHLTLANAFNLYMHTREENQKGEAPRVDLDAWCRQYFLDIAVLEEVRKTREAVGRFMKNASKTPATRASGRDTESVRKALAIAFCTQTAIYDGSSDNYRTVHENVLARLAPLSVLLNGKYEWIVYTALNATGGKVFLETATPINAEWLVDLPYFQDERLPRKKDKLKSLRQPKVKISLDAAKARLTAAKARLDAAETN